MRYINKQKHNTTCGPVALANALKWLGYSCSYNSIVKDMKDDCDPYSGMTNSELSKIFDDYSINHRYQKWTKDATKAIERCLDRGNAVILNYTWFSKTDSQRHYIFIDGHLRYRFNSYNDGIGYTKTQFNNYNVRAKLEDKRAHTLWEIYR